ncbi:MAG: alpha/beta hydrolase [Labilithrix sp.]|nr:alpha/beta hydrolase [Labilithrix sp.]
MAASIRASLRAVLAGTTILLASASGCASAEEDADASSDEIVRRVPCGDLPATWLETTRLAVDDGNVQLRVGQARPAGPVRGDILFFHGFSDRLDNHRPLFEAWTARGFRVVSFEYPSHGETCGKSLAFYLYPSLARLAAEVERATREDEERPLLLAGWSMGGLLATRLLQGLEPLDRPVRGAVLFTPGVAVHLFLDRVRRETLTRNEDPPHTGPITPTRPALYPIAANLLVHASRARAEALPAGVPVLTITGGDEEDVYAKSAEVRSWVGDQRRRGAATHGLDCPGGFHEIDNEPAPMGPSVRSAAATFAEDVLTGEPREPAGYSAGPCTGY